MKKLLLLLLFFSGMALYSQEFYSFGEFSYFPNLNDNYELPDGTYFGTSIGIGFEFKGIYAEVQQKTMMTKSESFMFAPFREDYYIRAGFTFWAVGIEWEHLCKHDVEWYGIEGGHDKVSINFDTRRLRENK